MCCQSVISFVKQWRLWIRPLVVAIYALVIIILVPILIINSIHNGVKKRDQGTIVGGAFVLLAIPISVWEIIQHMVHYTKPHLQKHIIRILWMVPIYAVNAWLGLEFAKQSIYLDSLRECYEAYVIYNFMKFLLNYLNEDTDLEASLENKPQVYHIFPLCCLTPWEMGREFVHMCKHGILQYTIVRPLTTIISVICELSGVYGEGEFKGDVAFPYMIAINNLSQFVAMYCLVLFYRANRIELRPMKPIGKFLCIKAVVFFSFFQGVIINILVYFKIISSIFNTDNADTINTISSKLQDFLICIEMFLAAIAHYYSFSHKPYISPDNPSPSVFGAFLAMWDISDVKRDISEHLGVVGSSLSRRLRGRSSYHLARGCDENSRLVGEGTSSSCPNLPTGIESAEISQNTANESMMASNYGSVNNTSYVPPASESQPLLKSEDEEEKNVENC